MDALRFDALSRRVGGRRTRRESLGVLLGGLSVAILGSRTEGDAAPLRGKVCQEFGRKCGQGKQKRIRCCGNATCRQGRCRCAASQRLCQDRCIPQADCCRDQECGGGEICRAGQCQCPPGMKACDGACIPNDGCCGGCPAGERCGEGSCGCVPDPAACFPPGSPCPGNTSEGCFECCSGTGFPPINGQPWTCDSPAPGGTCGPVASCAGQGTLQDCECHRCCLRSGASTGSFGNATCASCCSGACAPDGLTCT